MAPWLNDPTAGEACASEMGSSSPGYADSATLLDQLEREFLELFRRDGMASDDPAGAARVLRLLLARQGPESGAAAQVLEASGIRAQWNAALGERRSRTLADWLGPHLIPPVLDVLAGDRKVAEALSRRFAMNGGYAVHTVERDGHYPTVQSLSNSPHSPYVDEGSLPDSGFNSVLICAVLHHEEDPKRLLDKVAAVRSRRWVITENCLMPRYQQDFHTYMDIFFNRCLNKFGLSCTMQHRTHDAWCEMLSHYGTVTLEEERSVPGIPFPYVMYVVDR